MLNGQAVLSKKGIYRLQKELGLNQIWFEPECVTASDWLSRYLLQFNPVLEQGNYVHHKHFYFLMFFQESKSSKKIKIIGKPQQDISVS